MFIFLIAQVLGQCVVRQDVDTQFFTFSTETIYIPLMDYFLGQNLTFSSDDAITISNVIQNVQNIDTNFNIQATATFLSQFTKVWLEYTAQIGTNENNEIMVNIYKDQDGEFVLYYQQFIPQGSQALQCGGLAFIDAHQLFVDCGYLNETDNKIYNQFYIVSKNSQTVSLLDYTTQSISTITQLQIVLGEDAKSIIVFRGVYSSNLIGELFIYKLNMSVYTLTLLNTITTLQMVDFESINFNLYLLNQTQIMQVYSFSDFVTPQFTFNISQLLGNVVFYTFDVQFDEQSFFIYTSAFKQNLVQIDFYQILNYHNVRITDQLTSMPQLYNNDKIIALEVNNVIYFYSRRAPFNLISILNQNLISINQSPFLILTYANSQIYFSYLTTPVAMGNFSKNTLLSITANAQNEFGKAVCTQQFNITVLTGTSQLLQQKNYSLPLTAIANREATYLKIQNFVSGPLLNFNASSNQSIIFNNPSITYNQSIQVWQHIQGIESFYSTDYNSYSQIVIESNYIKGVFRNSVLTLRICDINLKTRIFLLENLYCTEFRNILTLNAPINKFQFTDLTESNVVYAVMDLAKAAVIIYELINFSSLHQIKSKFICEPIPVDDYRYQHGIDDFTVIGTNLFLVLTKIGSIWVYDVPTCTKRTEITNVKLNHDFLPKYILGTSNLQTPTLVGQLLFIGTENEVMIVEILNSFIYRLMNVIEFPSNTTDSAVRVVNDILIIVLISQYKQEIKTYKFYPGQPTIEPKYIKSLPLYGFLQTNPIVISSDLQYFYALMNDGYYNVYNPSLDFNDCLVYQLAHIGDYISPHYIPNLSKQSLIMLASTATIVTYSITNPQLIEFQFYPTSNDLLHSNVSYQIKFNSNVSTNVFTLSNSTIIYDTLIVGVWNQTQFNQQNNDNDSLSTSNGIININMDNVLQNNIVSYFSMSNNFNTINPLNLNQVTNFTNINANQMVSLYNGTVLVQNQVGIYYLTTQNLEMIYQFSNTFSQCNQLEYNGLDQLLSICSYYENYYFYIFNTSNIQQAPIILTSKNTIYEPIKSYLINNTIITLAIHTLSNYYQIQLFTFDSTDIQYQMQIGCGLGLQGDVSDFQIIQGDNQFLLIYTCPYIQEVQMAVIIINSNTDIQLSKQQTIKLKFELPKQAQFLELVPILINQNYPIFLLTTRQFYSFIIQLDIQQTNSVTSEILGYVAPMQQGILLKQTQYYDNTLYMVYQLDNTEILLASYNLKINNIKISQLIYSQDALNYNNQIIYVIMSPNNLLCIYDKSQSFLLFNSQNKLQIQYSDLDEGEYTVQFGIVQKYGKEQYIQINVTYIQSGLQWWGWCLIAIGSIVLLAGIGITMKAIYDKKRKREDIEKDLMIPNTMELNASIKT